VPPVGFFFLSLLVDVHDLLQEFVRFRLCLGKLLNKCTQNALSSARLP